MAALPHSSSQPLWSATVSSRTLSHKATSLGILPPSSTNRMCDYPPPEMTGSGIALGAVCKCLGAAWLWGDLLCEKTSVRGPCCWMQASYSSPADHILCQNLTPPEVFLALLWKLTSEKWQEPKSNIRAWGELGEREERSSSTLTSAAHCSHHLSRQRRRHEERCQGGNGAEAWAQLLQPFFFFF